MRDTAGQSLGYGYVQYASVSQGVAAINKWDGQEIAGQALKITVAPPASAATLGPGGVAPGTVPLTLDVSALGVPGLTTSLPGPPPMAPQMPAQDNRDTSISELDDEEEMRGGLKLNSNTRQALMSRLASSAGKCCWCTLQLDAGIGLLVVVWLRAGDN